MPVIDPASSTKGPAMPTISRRPLLAGLMLLAATPQAVAALPTLEVWKMRGCTCCAGWAKHFEAAGFVTKIQEVDDVATVRAELGVPADLGGCHTSKVESYIIEGHVPVAAVQRLLAERPAILGLAVPGMPLGSPGMEIEGEPTEPYDVIAFAADGTRSVFMEVRP
jgi:hypothetical protein